jgi:hypothetical protein
LSLLIKIIITGEINMSCIYGFVNCLKARREMQERNQNRAPLLAANAIEVPIDATNPIDVAGEQSGEESIENVADDRNVEVSALEQQQRDELFARTSPVLQRTMPEPSAPPAPADFVAQSTAGGVAQAEPVNPTGIDAQDESITISTEQDSSAAGGASLRSSEIPPGPPSPLARVNGFKNRAGARLAGVFVPRGKRPDTPIYKFPNQDGDDRSSRQGEFDALKGMPFAEVEATF